MSNRSIRTIPRPGVGGIPVVPADAVDPPADGLPAIIDVPLVDVADIADPPANVGFVPPAHYFPPQGAFFPHLAAMVKNRILHERNFNLRKKFKFRVAGEAFKLKPISMLSRCSSKSML